MVTFTHDRELPWLLPGVAPTGRQVEVLAISVVSVRHRSRAGRTTTLIAGHRTLWDQVGACGPNQRVARRPRDDRRGTGCAAGSRRRACAGRPPVQHRRADGGRARPACRVRPMPDASSGADQRVVVRVVERADHLVERDDPSPASSTILRSRSGSVIGGGPGRRCGAAAATARAPRRTPARRTPDSRPHGHRRRRRTGAGAAAQHGHRVGHVRQQLHRRDRVERARAAGRAASPTRKVAVGHRGGRRGDGARGRRRRPVTRRAAVGGAAARTPRPRSPGRAAHPGARRVQHPRVQRRPHPRPRVHATHPSRARPHRSHSAAGAPKVRRLRVRRGSASTTSAATSTISRSLAPAPRR